MIWWYAFLTIGSAYYQNLVICVLIWCVSHLVSACWACLSPPGLCVLIWFWVSLVSAYLTVLSLPALCDHLYTKLVWACLVSACLSVLVLLLEHEGPVSCVTISPEGLRVLSCTRSGELGVLDVPTRGYQTLMRSHTDSLLAFSTHPTNGQVATVSTDNTIRIWDMSSLQQVRWWHPDKFSHTHNTYFVWQCSKLFWDLKGQSAPNGFFSSWWILLDSITSLSLVDSSTGISTWIFKVCPAAAK